MFSPIVLDHFSCPRNVGMLPDATASVEVSNPVCGDILRLSARLENGCIAEARFLCQGCTTAIACASLLTVELTGCQIADANNFNADYLSAKLGDLPPATKHAAQLASDAVAALIAKLQA